MPKLVVDAATFADESLTSQAVEAAQAGAGGNGPFPATQVRDSSGKLIQVIIGVPENEHANLGNMKEAISRNPGAASVVSFPIVDSDDFEAGTGQVNTIGEKLNYFGGWSKLWYTSYNVDGQRVWQRASLLYTQAAGSTFYTGSSTYRVPTNTYSVSSANVLEMACKLYLNQDLGSTRGDSTWKRSLVIMDKLNFLSGSRSWEGAGNWVISPEGGITLGQYTTENPLPLNISADTPLDIRVRFDANTDDVMIIVNGSLVYFGPMGTNVLGFSNISLTMSQEDIYSTANPQNGKQRTQIDDFELKILA